MSKGTAKKIFRCPPKLVAMVEEEIAISEKATCHVAYTWSSFTVAALREFVRKRRAGRKGKSRTKPTPTPSTPE